MMPKSSRLGVADFWTLVCAAVMLLAFLILPWLVSATGMRVLMGTENVPQSVNSTPLLLMIPLAAAASLVLVVWGIFSAPRKRFAAWITLLVAFAGLAYFVSFAITNGSNLGTAILFLGPGFWIAFLANVGLVAQVAVPRPRPEKPKATSDCV
jgi:predicted anti-sigma-YlaC factor YlaD